MNTNNSLRQGVTALLLATTLTANVALAAEPTPATDNVQHLRLVSLRSSVGFRSNVVQLDAEMQREVERLGLVLANLPNAQITVSGYCDASGPGELNLQLSLLRAQNVRIALEAAGVDPARIHVEANGEWFAPQAAIDANSRARLRRVEIAVEQRL